MTAVRAWKFRYLWWRRTNRGPDGRGPYTGRHIRRGGARLW